MNCLACGEPMVPRIGDALTHASCLMVEPVEDEANSFSEILRTELTEIIMWQAARAPRSLQANIGPSEIGSPCDRQIGYRVAGIPEINVRQDPWAAVIGTAIHKWLQEAVEEWVKRTGESRRFFTEIELNFGDLITGHCDLYDAETQTVIDWKTVGPNALKDVEEGRISVGYMIQTQLYGYLFAQQNIPVKRVSLVFIPRASSLNRLRVWSARYDPTVAETALARLYRIAREVLARDVLNKSHAWADVSAEGGDHCGFCPWFEAHRLASADATGCPGR
jgi:PD-(D/E)XK nuclease superfamily protein